jgi:hypothetical protein
MKENNEDNTTPKSGINDTMAFNHWLCASIGRSDKHISNHII